MEETKLGKDKVRPSRAESNRDSIPAFKALQAPCEPLPAHTVPEAG